MKNLVFLAITGIALNLQAQNVGIGTNTPSRKLHIHGDAANFTALSITNNGTGQTAGDGFQIGLFYNAENPAQQYGSVSTYENMPLYFATNNLLHAALSTTGNLGIGTLTPIAKVHTLGSSGENMLLAQPSGSEGGISLFSSSANQVSVGLNIHRPVATTVRLSAGHGAFMRYDRSTGDLATFISSASGDANTSPSFWNPLTFKGTTGYTRLSNYVGLNIDPHPDSGRMVIAHNSGITSPTLQLVETSTTDYARIEFANQANSRFWQITGNQSNSGTNFDRLNFYHSNAGDLISLAGNGSIGMGAFPEAGDGKLLIHLNSSTLFPHLKLRENNLGDYSRLEFTNSGAERVWHIAGQTVAGAGTTNRGNDILNIWNSSFGDMMSFRGDGRIGVWTTTPAVGYAFSVNGRIMCEELRVQLSESWPDYVFSDTYQLAPLSEVSRFIKSNKHLPGIPSAAIIEKEGLSVGDMQRRMMEKIEELTLYILELKTEIDQLKEKQ